MKKITLTGKLLSPLLAGARRTAQGDFIASKNYIPGSIIRAAFAQEIVNSCAVELAADERDKYWVKYHAAKACETCPWQAYCRNFAQLVFCNWYIDNSKPVPMTMQQCKNDKEHPKFDSLSETIKTPDKRLKCCKCQADNRVERASGFYTSGAKGEVTLKTVRQRLIARAGIDSYRKTSSEGVLYTLRPLNGGQNYGGEILFPKEVKIDKLPVAELLIGAKTSSGFGEIKISGFAVEDLKPLVKERLKEFNAMLSEVKNFVTVTCQSDVELPPEISAAMQTDHGTDNLLNLLLPGAPAAIIPEMFYVDYYAGGGFGYYNKDPEQGKLLQTRPGRLYMKMGSVLVFSFEKNVITDDIHKWLQSVEDEGIGQNTHNGFGRVVICDEIHYGGTK